MIDGGRNAGGKTAQIVRLSYYVDAPSSWAFCARLGPSGWYEGWGGDVDEALDELAQVLMDEPQAELPAALRREPESIRRWLEERVDVPVLEGDLLLSYPEEAPSSASC